MIKSWFSIFGYSVKVAFVFGLAGLFIGGCLISGYITPPWESSTIIATRDDVVDILLVNFFFEDYTDDEIYVKTKSGKIYLIYMNEWDLVPNSDDNWEKQHNQNGSNSDSNNSISKWRFKPPVKKGVIDSYGDNYERPVSDHHVCYVLFDNGLIQLWARRTDVFGLFVTIGFSVLVGLIIGGIIGFNVKYKKNKQSVKSSVLIPENDV